MNDAAHHITTWKAEKVGTYMAAVILKKNVRDSSVRSSNARGENTQKPKQFESVTLIKCKLKWIIRGVNFLKDSPVNHNQVEVTFPQGERNQTRWAEESKEVKKKTQTN
ncbi:hypothetical protein POVCU2_0016950 [Plasmodium ovale curtisi]|uniref:Uncharacterized protein n=1 Tax=Plasmodium ovale curtisi TaxID=864141 RepID=A0A1A8W701_PLAOA|nr:hypothetical protein POVCU2_0016950 [Plasmodium ovale curtisi]SBS87763.1 hypothetical protein POVCU1_015210 [Plasmodium ovale curtisi]